MEHRENCPRCGDTRERLYIRRVVGGTVRHCHNNNCYQGRDAFIPDRERTPTQTIAYVNQYLTYQGELETTVKEIRLPKDFTSVIPNVGLHWLYKYDITDEEIESFGIGWSDSYQRLILPVYQNGSLIYWQGRTFRPITKDNPKYMNIRQSGCKSVFFTRTKKGSKELCVVEDILSAIKVGRYVNSLALLGSYFPSSIYPLYRHFEQIYIWLDSDKLTTAIKEARRLSATSGQQVKVVRSQLDPKEQLDTDIITSLGGYK